MKLMEVLQKALEGPEPWNWPVPVSKDVLLEIRLILSYIKACSEEPDQDLLRITVDRIEKDHY